MKDIGKKSYIALIVALAPQLSLKAGALSSATRRTSAGTRHIGQRMSATALQLPVRKINSAQGPSVTPEQEDYERRRTLGLLTHEEFKNKQDLANTYEIRRLQGKLTSDDRKKAQERDQRALQELEAFRQEQQRKKSLNQQSWWERLVAWLRSGN